MVTGNGTVTLEAYQNANSNYAAGSTQLSFTVGSALNAGLVLTIPTQTYGTAPFALNATSNSPAHITYTVLNGPAKLSGNVLTLTGVGTVTVAAQQPVSGNYPGSTVKTWFTVQGELPTITIPAVTGKTTISAPFTVTATSTSPAPISYKLLSGPARISAISGATATLVVTGNGTVTLEAYQNAGGNYAGGSTQTSFTIGGQ